MTDFTDWNAEVASRAREAGELFAEFVKTIAQLRHPESGCPWDLKQNHDSLRRFMLEEAYEAASAMLGNDVDHLIEELGDVLLQVVLNAQVSKDMGNGDIRAVISSINSKMIRRHPHVFASKNPNALTESEVKSNWEKIKEEEKQGSKVKRGFFEEIRKIHPALTQAFSIGKKSGQISFDWPDLDSVWSHFKSEVNELEMELKSQNYEEARKELADVFFTLAQVSRHLGHEPETIAQEGNEKFLRRFSLMEDAATVASQELRSLSQEQLEGLWKIAKEKE